MNDAGQTWVDEPLQLSGALAHVYAGDGAFTQADGASVGRVAISIAVAISFNFSYRGNLVGFIMVCAVMVSSVMVIPILISSILVVLRMAWVVMLRRLAALFGVLGFTLS